MKVARLLSFLAQTAIMVAILFTLTTCKKKAGDPTPETDPFVITPTAKFIVDNDWQSMIKSIDSTNYTLTFDKGLMSKYSFVQGDIMVSSVGNGLLRKIESITQSGGTVQIQTSQATLTDLIQSGDIDFSDSLTVSGIKSIKYYYPGIYLDTIRSKSTNGSNLNWNINTEISPLIRLQGNFQYKSNFVFQIQISISQGLKKVNFGVQGSEAFNLALVAGQQFNFSKEIKLTTVYFSPFLISLPSPPFVIVVNPELDIKVGVNGFAIATISTSLSQNFQIKTGVQYLKAAGWSSYLDTVKTLTYSPPQLTANAGAEAYIKPELQMLMFNVTGPYVNGKGYGRIAADTAQNPWWKMYYGLTMSAGAKATILSHQLFDYNVGDLLSWEKQVGVSSGMPPTVTTNSVTNITETNATCGGNVTAKGSSSVTARGVCWSTSQNPIVLGLHSSDGSGTGSFTSNLTGLVVNTLYYVRAYATNEDGTAYGNQVSFSTGQSTFTDPRDGRVYNIVTIGTQTWFAQNLNYPSTGSHYYNDDTLNGIAYGRYYSTYDALNSCPSGWHLPSDDQWTILTNYLGGMNIAGGKMKETGFTHWASPNTGATNESGFSAFGGGYGNIWQDTNGISHLSFYNMGHTANFWSSTAVNDSSLYDRHLETISGMIYQYSFWSSYFYNVRCIKNN